MKGCTGMLITKIAVLGLRKPTHDLKKPMHPLQMTLWCSLWSRGIIGPYLFENKDDATITIIRDTYRTIIPNLFLYPLFMVLLWTLFGFNRIVQLALIHLLLKFVMGAKKLRFDTVELFIVKRKVLCRQTRKNVAFEGQHSWCHCRDTTPYTRKSARKLVRSKEVLWYQTWQPYEWNHIPFLTATIVLHNNKKK